MQNSPLNKLIDWLEHNTDLSTPCEGCGKVIKPGNGHKMIVGLPARPGGGLCGDTDAADLIYEFAQVARTNPHADKDKLLFNMLMENHKCSKTGGEIHNPASAGALIDMCHAGDIGFDLCSEYRAGFSNFLFLFSKLTETQGKIKILCGDENIASNSTIWLDSKLQADFRLRQQPAVKLMFDELKIHMPCPNHTPPPAEVRELMTQEETLNFKCVVGSRLPGVILVRPGVEDERTDDNSTQKACDERDVLLQKIKARNWCWGHDGQIEANRYWEPCTPLVPTPGTNKERYGTLPKERK